MSQEVMTYVWPIIATVVTSAVGIIAFGARKLITVGVAYLESRIGVQAYDQLKTYASTIVRSLEQTPAYQTFAGDQKKEIAINYLSNYAVKLGLENLPNGYISDIVEEAVQIMNTELSKIDVFGEIED